MAAKKVVHCSFSDVDRTIKEMASSVGMKFLLI